MTTTTPEIDPDDTTAPALPVTGDELELIDGARVVVLSRRHATTPGRDTWTVKGPNGRRIIRRSQIARFLNDSDDVATPELPVPDDELRLTDGTTARVLQQYDETLSRIMTGQDAAWQVTGPTGARVITLDKVAGYVADEASDVDHAAALVLNAALDWERACERGFVTEHMAAADELHKAIRAWSVLVAE